MLESNFDNYLRIKKCFCYFSDGISYEKVLTPEFVKVVYSEDFFKEISYLEILKIFFRQISFAKLITAFEESDIVVTNSNDRKDTIELLTSCFSFFENCRHVRLTSLKRYYGFNHCINDIFNVFAFFFSRDKDSYNLKVKLYLAISTIYYMNVYRSLNKSFSNSNVLEILSRKKYVAFNSAYDLETLITQYLKSKGVKTFHLSHGITYVKYKVFKPFDCVNGENINADTILVWGESSKSDLLNNYFESVKGKLIIVSGNPKYPFKQIELKNIFQKCIVFLGRNIYDKENVELLKLIGKVAIETGIHFSIKCHPFSDENIIKKITDKYNLALLPKSLTISEILSCDKYDFSICYNTTVYYEAMYFSMFCFRYSIGENENYLGIDDKFHSSENLIELIHRYRNLELKAKSKEVEELLIRTLGMGINKYNQILNNE